MPFPNPDGQPTKLTPEVQTRIIQALAAGNYLVTAAAFAGIRSATLHEWLRRAGRERQRQARGFEPSAQEAVYLAFADAVEQAQAQGEVRAVSLIGKAAEENWTAAAWTLERKFPERWGRRDTVTVLKKLAQELDGMDDDELIALAYGCSEAETGESEAGAARDTTPTVEDGDGL